MRQRVETCTKQGRRQNSFILAIFAPNSIGVRYPLVLRSHRLMTAFVCFFRTNGRPVHL